ncbi:hypothetical protein ACFOG5_08915 [Pedobacter fastidiosus]|uniref:DUF4304 domain-containing protein n=1 Tax=Pedobacter fastidiosus TaxID=2765361 RepID=A0ABR7KTD4_9SPHI|nr:hypothetical protein [Pedobacter fastidiosus]MBC6111321.1 hypothetical protein [Pedobacter fastidiosus]
MVSLKGRKQAFFEILNPYFKAKGFVYTQGIPQGFVKDSKLIYLLFFRFYTRTDLHEISPLRIHFREVENIIKEVGEPNYDYSLEPREYLFGSISKEFSDTYNQKFSELDLKTINGFEQWAHLIIDYMEGEGKAFMEHYSYLPNVLKEMDRLEAEGKYWNEIIIGLADYDFRGLIISKLCNDLDYDKKVASRDEVFYNIPQLSEWLPYYENLKQKLKSVEPIYNI